MTTINELTPKEGWISCADVRIPTPSVSQQNFLFRLLSKFSRLLGRDKVPDMFSVFQIHGRIFWPWLFFASRLMPYGALDARMRELIILRTAWNCRCRYEWGQHVEIALSAGVSDTEIVAVSEGHNSFSDRYDRATILACDELFYYKALTDLTWNILSEKYNVKLIIEIIVLAGHYIMLAGLLNTASIRLEPPIEEELSKFHDRIF